MSPDLDPAYDDAPRAPERDESARRTAERERDAAEASRDRFAFLAEVSRCLADSLDYETTLTTVAGMSLPYLGAWCIVDVLTEDGEIRRLAVLHPDPSRQDAARALYQRYPPHADDLIGVPRVLRTGRPEMVFEVSEDALAAAARDDEHLALLRTLGIRSYVIVPMVARGHTLGAITFVTADDSRRFGDIDVVIAEDLARRAAMAVDNARLHAQALEARHSAEEALVELEIASEELRHARDVAENTLVELEAANQDLHEARDVAEAALKARSEFLATMTHEVRTPLNAIVGYMELLEMDVAGELSPGQRAYVTRVRDSSRHLLRLVEDVLDFSRSDAGGLEVASEVVRAADTARAAVSIVRPQAESRLVSLEDRSGAVDGLQYRGDEYRVRQVLLNLLSNAVKFTPPGGRVTLECAVDDDTPGGPWLLFRVRDTGQGVTPDDAAVIFEAFVQGEAGLTRKHGGIGLGLAISRELARLMGGDLVLEDPGCSADGGGETGATFTLRVLAAPPDPREERSAAPGADGGAPESEPSLGDVPHRTEAQREDARRGLRTASEALLRELTPSLEEFVRRARADPELGVSREMSDVEVADHLSTLVTDLANSLAILSQAGGEPTEALSDGNKIQRVIGELHGAQRRRLGWTEEQLMREAAVVRDVCREAVDRALAGDGAGTEAATVALEQLLRERVRACLSGFRAASD